MKKENYLNNIYSNLEINLPITEDSVESYVDYCIDKHIEGYPWWERAIRSHRTNWIRQTRDNINIFNNDHNTRLKDNLRGLLYNLLGLDIRYYGHKNIHQIYEDFQTNKVRYY